jgi:hypothetical protein
MQWMRYRGKSGAFGRSLKGLILLGLFVSVMGLVSFSGLHKTFHPNASNPEHHCVVTLLTSGQVEVSAGVPAIIAPDVVSISLVLLEPSFQTEVSFNLPLSRGPPALL